MKTTSYKYTGGAGGLCLSPRGQIPGASGFYLCFERKLFYDKEVIR